MSSLPAASISLDLDNQWAYMKTHGDPDWERLPSYLDVFVPRALALLEELNLVITFFIVGQDAALQRNREALALLTAKGHEVGNHSFHHEPWGHHRSPQEIRAELHEAAEAIVAATGQQPRGYRGPGFSWSPAVFEALADADYEYDASTFPTYLGPLARMYYFRRSSLSADEMEKRKELFGGFAEGRRPIKQYLWQLPSGRTLLEIPVTTIPLFRVPFHLSYLLYLARRSGLLMSTYLRIALGLCRSTGTEPSFLLHPLDLIGPEEAPQLAFFPAMDVSSERKRSLFRRVMREIGKRFEPVPLGEHARRLRRRGDLPLRALPGGAGA